MISSDQILLKYGDTWLHFTEPFAVIHTNELRDVLPSLRELEELVNERNWHAAGFLSYEAASAFDEAHQTHGATDFPLLWFGLYPKPVRVALPEPASQNPALTWTPTVDRQTYNAAIDTVRSHIAEGQTYQVNYTMRLHTRFSADAWNFFLHLAQTQNNHAAYIDTGRFVIASASPEIFFQLDGETITCRPMKGTTRRGRTTAEDAKQAEWLKDSEKNRAENVMIVDMIRNDLGRIAKVGSLRVPELFTVEKYPTLWQMTSSVQAQTSASLTKIFTALFPCASITGAPKVSTMRIISELETTPRNIYTGSIGYIAPNRNAKFNVAIRTALIDREAKTAEYGVGGGIVWDSESGDEYEEALLKARVLTESPPEFSLLETMVWTPEEGFFLRDKHIARLLDSAEYFGFSVSNFWDGATPPLLAKEILASYLHEISSDFTFPQRVRLLLDKNDKITTEHASMTSSTAGTCKVRLAKQPINSNDIFLFHKTTNRTVYENAKKDFHDFDDVLLFNERGELTEFTIGNLVVKIDGRFFTPPISCGLLAGTFRAHLLETGQVEERVIRVEALEDCSEIYRVNSVRRWERVECG